MQTVANWDELKDAALAGPVVLATVARDDLTLVLELIKSQGRGVSTSELGLPDMRKWELTTRYGEPYIFRVRVTGARKVLVAQAQVSWWGSIESAPMEDSVFVAKSHRRRGIASAMYHLIESAVGSPIVPSKYHTADGNRLWRGLVRGRRQAA